MACRPSKEEVTNKSFVIKELINNKIVTRFHLAITFDGPFFNRNPLPGTTNGRGISTGIQKHNFTLNINAVDLFSDLFV